jgi:hypothetical protein
VARHVRLIFVCLWVVSLIAGGFAFGLTAKADNPKNIALSGKLMDVDKKAIPNGIVTVEYDGTVLKAASNAEGNFTFKIHALDSRKADIRYEAQGFSIVKEKGVLLEDGMDLSKTLVAADSVGGAWVAILLLPGVAGLIVAAWKEGCLSRKGGDDHRHTARRGGGRKAENAVTEEAAYITEDRGRFLVALMNGTIWGITLFLLALLGQQGALGIYQIRLFNPGLAFELYVPFLGLVGASLYVFDLFRRGPEEISKGEEFGMRLIMAPYVAIVMVVLFGKDLGVINLASPVSRGILAFFSGLLVVVALQGLTEKGQEVLGEWRNKSRYKPSEIAEIGGFSKEDDLKMRQAGFRYMNQVLERDESALREELKKVGLDENLAPILLRMAEKDRFRKRMGELVRNRLKKIGVETIDDFAHLDDAVLEQIAKEDPPLLPAALVELRDQAAKVVKEGGCPQPPSEKSKGSRHRSTQTG